MTTDTLQQHRQRGARFIALDHLEAALAEYEKLVAAAPEDGEGRQQVAALLARLGRKAQAVAAYEEAALAWARGGQLLRAIVACKALLALEPGHTRTQRSLAELYGWRVKPGARRPASLKAMAEFELLPEGAGPSEGMPVVPLFSQLGQEPFAAVLEAMEVRTCPARQSVVKEGEPGASMFAVVEGTLEVVRHFQDGAQRQVGTLAEGAFFGELALISEGPRLASVVAASPGVLLEFTRAKLEALVRKHPVVGPVVQAFYRERMVDNLLRSNPAFSLLKPEQKQAVVREFTLKAAAEGEVLLKQGQEGEAFYLLLRGRCTPYHVKPDGQEKAYPELREGSVFGEISLLLGKPVTATVRANTPSVVLRLDRAAFERLILGLPGIRGALMKVGTERLQRTAKLLSGQEIHDGDLRV